MPMHSSESALVSMSCSDSVIRALYVVCEARERCSVWHVCVTVQKEETDRLRSQTTGLIGAMDCFSEGIMLVNTDSENWNILFVNDAWSRVTGDPRT